MRMYVICLHVCLLLTAFAAWPSLKALKAPHLAKALLKLLTAAATAQPGILVDIYVNVQRAPISYIQIYIFPLSHSFPFTSHICQKVFFFSSIYFVYMHKKIIELLNNDDCATHLLKVVFVSLSLSLFSIMHCIFLLSLLLFISPFIKIIIS